MAKSMVVVESPAKARTIEKYLGREFAVRACAGHIKDLPKDRLGVDIRHDFRPTYLVIPGKQRIVSQLKKEAARAEAIYLAADPDREGEAICQHLAEELNGQEGRRIYRVLFNEITKSAILEAFRHPGQIDQHKVEAQQARRILDRLVGYQVSPLLWRKVRRGLSAGRVQSVALRMIVEREREIRAFVPEEYWNFTAVLQAGQPPPFEAKAVKHQGKKFRIGNQEEAEQLLAELQKAEFIVRDVKRRQRRQNPVPPFITSKLQQEASRKLGFSVKKTMTLAQRLYEGVELGSQERTGLITYMRTDSTRIADSALEEVRELIKNSYGARYLPSKARHYAKKKGAQDAHEAIRPTSVRNDPESVRPYLSRDEYRLYDLIWKRFVASQMNPALFDQTEILIQAGETEFKAVGSILRFDGFLKVYREGQEENQEDQKNVLLPEVKVGDKLLVQKITPEQKFTQPPPRYNEASLVKALEEKGIGRPSTYAQILSVIQDREYVRKEDKRFIPTETGEVVNDLLVEHFPEIFDYDYTAKMEQNLDEIERGKQDWLATLRSFYKEFVQELQRAKKEMRNLKREEIPTGESCEKCGAEMVIRWGRFGRFLACKNYPECKNTREIGREESAGQPPSGAEEEKCPACGRPMILKKGRYGEFLSCSGYPECKTTRRLNTSGPDQPLEENCPQCGSRLVLKQGRYGPFTACSNYPECKYIKQETTGVTCPHCGKGEFVQRKSRRGKIFYSCNQYPSCRSVLWHKPVPEPCPQCGAPFLLERKSKKQGLIRTCHQQDCRYQESLEVLRSEG